MPASTRRANSGLASTAASSPSPAMLVAFSFAAVSPEEESLLFFLLLAAATAAFLTLNLALVLVLGAILDGRTIRSSTGALWEKFCRKIGSGMFRCPEQNRGSCQKTRGNA